VAAYLRGDGTASKEANQSDKVLDRLTREKGHDPLAAAKAKPSEPEAPTVDHARLDALASVSAAPALSTEATKESGKSEEDLSEADEKLSSLLGGEKKDEEGK